MKRPGGVIAVAVMEFAGSGLLVALAGLLMLTALGQLAAGGQEGATAAAYRAGQLVGLSLVYLLPAGWGILTAIALLRMRMWAVASTLVFAYLLVCAGAGIAIAAVWTPTAASNAAVETLMRLLLGGVALAVAGIGVWWLVYFFRRPVRAQFAASGGWARRPLSISMLGWIGVFAAGGCALGALLPHPALTFFGWPVTGGGARGLFLAIALAQLAVGWSLLRLKFWAGTAGLVLYALIVMNSIGIWVVPHAVEQMLARAAIGNPLLTNAGARSMMFAFALLGSVSGVITGLLCLYFLWTRRAAFQPPPAAAIPEAAWQTAVPSSEAETAEQPPGDQ